MTIHTPLVKLPLFNLYNLYFNFLGKHEGSVQGINYFTCKPKHGIFVKVDKLILDKRGRALHNTKSSNFPPPESGSNSMRRSQTQSFGMQNKAEGTSENTRNRPTASGNL